MCGPYALKQWVPPPHDWAIDKKAATAVSKAWSVHDKGVLLGQSSADDSPTGRTLGQHLALQLLTHSPPS